MEVKFARCIDLGDDKLNSASIYCPQRIHIVERNLDLLALIKYLSMYTDLSCQRKCCNQGGGGGGGNSIWEVGFSATITQTYCMISKLLFLSYPQARTTRISGRETPVSRKIQLGPMD